MLLLLILLLITLVIALKLYQKLKCGICKCSAHLVGKTVIVTGANAGIGYETALDLAYRGARVILACRSESRGKDACSKIIAATGNKEVVYKNLDLGSLTSVRTFAKDVIENEKKLHILINNAGVGGLGNKLTRDGLQIVMQVNYFGPYLLTRLLLPLLRSSAPSRIINVASSYHRFGKVDFANINCEKHWSGFNLYTNSKLCNILMNLELSKRLEGSGVTSNCLHPGVVATKIFRNIPNKVVLGVINKTLNFLFKSPWEGAQTTIYLSVSPEVSEVSGKYFSDCREDNTIPEAQDSNVAEKLWEYSERLVKLT